MVKNLPANAGDLDSVLGPGKIPHVVGQLSSFSTATEPMCASAHDKPPEEVVAPQLESYLLQLLAAATCCNYKLQLLAATRESPRPATKAQHSQK